MDEAIRQAASVVAAREGARGPEVLVLERAGGQRFLPGYVVFPGGAVDEADGELARAWFGDGDEAPRAAGVRELAEEAGLALTGAGLRSPGVGGWLADVRDSPPAAEQLVEIAHWVAPPTVPVRFDARYFAVAAPGGVEPRADGREATSAWWASPAELLAGFRDGGRRLYWPTFFTMLALDGCRNVEELLALRLRTREPREDELERLPRSTFEQD